MRWPRGRYNGRRIVGVEVKFQLQCRDWWWKPWIGHYCGAFHWLCVMSWWGWVYGDAERKGER